MLGDLHYAIRQLYRSRGFTLTAVLTLALGIGASSAIFCVIDALWLHPLRVPEPGEIFRVFATTPQDSDGLFTYGEYRSLSQRTSAFKSVIAIGRRGSILPRNDGTTSLLLTNVVSDNFFDALGVKPIVGRAFSASDADSLRTRPGVMLGYSFWQREFAGDPKIVGRQITVLRGRDRRVTMDVWGVLPAEFREVDNDSDRDLWMPIETWAAQSPKDLTSINFRWFNILGRIASSSTAAQANQQVAAIARGWQSNDPVLNHERGARAVSDFKYRMGLAGTSGIVLFAIVAGVVLLATLNVAHLLLARGLSRGPEVALRLSLGASRAIVARQLLLENLLLTILALIVGLGIAAATAAVLPRLLVQSPAMLVQVGSPGSSFAFDWSVFSMASVLAVLTMLFLALVPLSQVARTELLSSVQAASGMRSTTKTPAMRRVAIWMQVAISFALLVSTGALVRSFINTRTQSIGITRNQILLAWTQEPEEPMRNQVIDNMRAIPGVSRVAYAIRSPLSLSENGIAVHALMRSHPELREPVEIKFNAVSPNYFDVIGTRIVRGRGFVSSDDHGGAMPIIVNQTMAQKYWPGIDPIGQSVRLTSPTIDAQVIGVAENAVINRVGELSEPYLYVDFQQYVDRMSNMGEMTFALETKRNAMSMAQDARQALIHVNPLLDPMMVTSLPELIRYSAADYQMMAELVTALGAIGLALTIVGIYGFLAFRVTQRRREIGIRMALGATREATAWLVLSDTARMAAMGLGIGCALSIAAARFESSLLFGVKPLDGLSLLGSLCVLVIAVAAAAWLPALRAASVEPMQALRAE